MITKKRGVYRLQENFVTLTRALVVAGFLFCASGALSQTAPVLTIANLGTNVFTISVTNGLSTANYDVVWTPVLANDAYPWTWAAVGTTGQTNFTLNMATYQSGFFRGLQETNAIPLWQAADPKNQGAGILTVFIDSPTNGMVLQ